MRMMKKMLSMMAVLAVIFGMEMFTGCKSNNSADLVVYGKIYTAEGNHLYQTARDWTWARLIEDGKALLAIDPDQPTRILSTDKKALKAGGLCLALKGVPVKPTDDVDVEKEYQLIPIDSL